MYLGKLGEQIVLKSKKAFNKIKFLDYEIASSNEWFLKRNSRDKEARREYLILKEISVKKGIFI